MVGNKQRGKISPINSLVGGLTAIVASLYPLAAQNTINGSGDQDLTPIVVSNNNETETQSKKVSKYDDAVTEFYKINILKKLEDSKDKLKTGIYANKLHYPGLGFDVGYDFFKKNTTSNSVSHNKSNSVSHNKPNLDMPSGAWFTYPSILPKSDSESVEAFSRIKIFSFTADNSPGEKKIASVVYENIVANKKNVPKVEITLYADSKMKDEQTKTEYVSDSLEIKVYQNGKELVSKKSPLKEKLKQGVPHCLAIMYQHEANIEKPTGIKGLLSVLVDEDPNTKEEKNNYFKTEMFTNSLFQPGEYQERVDSYSNMKIASLYTKENAAVKEDKK